MKKRLLWILCGLASLFVVLLLVAGYFLNSPAFQKRMLLDALRDEGFSANAERVSVGLAKGRVESLLISNDDLSVNVPEVDIEYSLWALLFSGHIKIEKVYAKNIEVDLAASEESDGGKDKEKSEAGRKKEPFQGFFKGWHDSNTKLTVGDVDISGVLSLENGESLLFGLKGGDIYSSSTGTLDFQCKPNTQSSGSLPSVIGKLQLTLNESGIPVKFTIDAVTFDGSEQVFLSAGAERDGCNFCH